MSTGEGARVVAGRYRLSRELGGGSNGQVWESEDLLGGERIALKLLNAGSGSEPARVRREISALRLLCIPGVVKLLDEGIDRGQPFLVMELVDGAPFPGAGGSVKPNGAKAARTWSEIADATVALLETLARIHAAGVMHRDLKPANVLVSTSGRPTILDFGLAFGYRLGDGLTAERTILGTPAYLAPEQINGAQVDARSDLYSLGVMLYEALSGRLPHQGSNLQALMLARLTQRPAPLKDVAPDVPSSVSGIVDRLLACSADERPRSAMEVLGLLRGEPMLPVAERSLPRLGGDAAVQDLVRLAREGRSVTLCGTSGSGRSRCLLEAAKALEAEGRRVIWILPAARPFGSFEGLLGALSGHETKGLDAITRELERQVLTAFSEGAVLFVDDTEHVDRWTLEIIARCRSHGAVVEAVLLTSERGQEHAGGRETIPLEPLSEADLRPLFAGPDRLFHLRSDAARALWTRTGGLPSRVVSEIAAWVRAGIARWSNREVVIDREALDWLEAGLRMSLPSFAHDAARLGGASLPQPLEDLLAWMTMSWPNTDAHILSTAMGQPSWRVEAELDELVARGVARRLPDGRFEPLVTTRVDQIWSSDRTTLAHRSLAEAFPPGTEGRLLHLIAGQEAQSIPEACRIGQEAAEIARWLAATGHLGRALAALKEGLLALRCIDEPSWEFDPDNPEPTAALLEEEQLLGQWVEIALSEGTAHALDRVLYELCRAPVRSDMIKHLEDLVRASLDTLGTAGERALEAVNAIPPFRVPELERWRQGIRVFAARHCSEQREVAVLEEVTAWAQNSGDPFAPASLAGWLGRLRYRQGRFDEAAELQFASAEAEPWVTAKVFKIVSSAGALLEAFRLEEAALRAQMALDLCRSFRHPHYESRAEWLLRAVAYRSGATDGPDREFVDAVTLIGVPAFEALVRLTEAAAAWRADQKPCALELSQSAYRLWMKVGNEWGMMLATSLALASGSASKRSEIAAFMERAPQCPIVGIAAQALALLSIALPEMRGSCTDVCADLTRGIPPARWHTRMDILSIAESLDLMGIPLEVALERHREPT